MPNFFLYEENADQEVRGAPHFNTRGEVVQYAKKLTTTEGWRETPILVVEGHDRIINGKVEEE